MIELAALLLEKNNELLAHSFLGSCTIGDKLRDFNFILRKFSVKLPQLTQPMGHTVIILISANPPPLLAAI